MVKGDYSIVLQQEIVSVQTHCPLVAETALRQLPCFTSFCKNCPVFREIVALQSPILLGTLTMPQVKGGSVKRDLPRSRRLQASLKQLLQPDALCPRDSPHAVGVPALTQGSRHVSRALVSYQ